MAGQGGAAQRNPEGAGRAARHTVGGGYQSVATIGRPSTGPGKIWIPAPDDRSGPHVKQFGKKWWLNPGYCSDARSASSGAIDSGAVVSSCVATAVAATSPSTRSSTCDSLRSMVTVDPGGTAFVSVTATDGPSSFAAKPAT